MAGVAQEADTTPGISTIWGAPTVEKHVVSCPAKLELATRNGPATWAVERSRRQRGLTESAARSRDT